MNLLCFVLWFQSFIVRIGSALLILVEPLLLYFLDLLLSYFIWSGLGLFRLSTHRFLPSIIISISFSLIRIIIIYGTVLLSSSSIRIRMCVGKISLSSCNIFFRIFLLIIILTIILSFIFIVQGRLTSLLFLCIRLFLSICQFNWASYYFLAYLIWIFTI